MHWIIIINIPRPSKLRFLSKQNLLRLFGSIATATYMYLLPVMLIDIVRPKPVKEWGAGVRRFVTKLQSINWFSKILGKAKTANIIVDFCGTHNRSNPWKKKSWPALLTIQIAYW